ncbi:MAG: flotillin family protein, partial [Anaerolineae bacterium]|nr:flotillin family protein [Anaerolineae bacterium]
MDILVGAALLILFFVVIVVLTVYLSRIRTIGPNEVLIISGMKRTDTDPTTGQPVERSFRIVKGGRAFI